jgi:predicted histidine transporter YuiF (NhaC family)
MFTALASFLASGALRMIFGELVNIWTKFQDHKQEMAMAEQQERFAAAQHARNQEAIKTQAELDIKVVHVQAEAAVDKLETEAFLEGVKATSVVTGVGWVDAWNAVIRPGVATWAVIMMTAQEIGWITLSEPTLAICGAALGLYLATRDLFKQGKAGR